MQRSGREVTPDSLPERTNEFTKQYAQAVLELGQELQLPVLDLWTLMQQQPGWQEQLLCDGLHFTAEGNRFVYTQLGRLIDKAYPDLRFVPHASCMCTSIFLQADQSLTIAAERNQ